MHIIYIIEFCLNEYYPRLNSRKTIVNNIAYIILNPTKLENITCFGIIFQVNETIAIIIQ